MNINLKKAIPAVALAAAALTLSFRSLGDDSQKVDNQVVANSSLESRVSEFNNAKQSSIPQVSYDIDYSRLYSDIRGDEGTRTRTYADTKNKPTIGVGFNLKRPGARRDIESLGLNYNDVLKGRVRLTGEQIDTLFKRDVQTAVRYSKSYIGSDSWAKTPSDVKEVVINMMYNMGYGSMEGMKDFRSAVQLGNYQKAADEMVDSQWYRNDVPSRARELTDRMRSVKK